MKFEFVVKHYMNAMSKMYRRGRDIIMLTNPIMGLTDLC